jgi:CII-binding regulator of phage lambda lysogenization HflD
VAAVEPVYDLQRLERAVSGLIALTQKLRKEKAALQREVQQQAARVATLEGQLLEANQKRQDVGKRIDELIAQIDQLDAQLEADPASGTSA